MYNFPSGSFLSGEHLTTFNTKATSTIDLKLCTH